MGFIVAVDGPSGSGKGTIAKEISKLLGLVNLDTGATYRCVALEVINKKIKLSDRDNIIKLLDNIDIRIENDCNIYLNNNNVTKRIRDNDVTDIVSQISSIIPVRIKMVELQRRMAQGKDVIIEGRDIGTYVFPNADIKIYLDADEQIRAKRRYEENIQKGMKTTYEQVLENIQIRDYNDKNKEIGSLKITEDYIIIDTSNMTIDQVVEKVKCIIQEKYKI